MASSPLAPSTKQAADDHQPARLPEHEVTCSECGGDTCGVEAVYDPAERDACLILWGVEDKMLAPDLGVKRAVGRPPANTNRSGGAGIAR